MPPQAVIMTFLLILVALLIWWVITRITNSLFGVLLSDKASAIATFACFSAIAVFFIATRITPARWTVMLAVVPLILLLVWDLRRTSTQKCPNCGRRSPRQAVACRFCNHAFGTGASVVDS